MKNLKRMLSLLLALLMMLILFTGCGSQGSETAAEPAQSEIATDSTAAEPVAAEPAGETSAAEGLSLPLTDETQELTVWIVYNGRGDLSEVRGVQEMEALTNVHINYVPVMVMEAAEKLGLMLSANEFPDIIYAGSLGYPGGVEAGLEDGVLIDMDDLIRNYMPNYMALLASNEQARKEATTDDGTLKYLTNIMSNDTEIDAVGTESGLVYRKDLLDAMDFDVPTTIDEWHEVLLACKEAGMSCAFSLDDKGGSELSLAWGVASLSNEGYWQVDGTEVQFAPMLDGYGEYLETMRQWYMEGLIDPNFTSGTVFARFDFSALQNDDMMLLSAMANFAGPALYTNQHWVDNEDFFLQAIQNPVLNEGDEPLQAKHDDIAKHEVYITSSCKNPELAARWLDFNYTVEGMYLNCYGVEGESYVIGDDGFPALTDVILNSNSGGASSSPEDALQMYAIDAAGTQFGRYDYEANLKLEGDGPNYKRISTEIWSEAKNIILTDSVQMDADETMEYARLFTAIETLVQEYTVNYILGTEDMSHEEFVQQLRDFGIDRCIEIQQAAYDRYLAR